MSETRTGGKRASTRQIEQFLASRRTNAHVRYEDTQVYLRRGLRWVGDPPEIRACLELSSITRRSRRNNVLHDPGAKSTGFMRRFMGDLERLAEQHGPDVYVDRVINRWLPDWLERRGYRQEGEPESRPAST